MKEPALDPDAGHAARNELVLTFYDDQHLDVFGDSSMRRPMAPTEKKLPRMVLLLAGLAAPVHLPRQQHRGDPGNRLEGSGILGDDPRPGQRGRVARF
ncbi:hypothetical protein [Bradyrhizobium sp. 153]|uniref:hypothetical protein n=1 Tax=Bradyrhizobium sp. 153 TaxID=2782627 RepID=UPI001FF9AEF6|nr:hypothetical protein [Bradyrhizobium sp. 153]MCK1670171.1 hypothetical protein [Bradyrhizobium sp. 153]